MRKLALYIFNLKPRVRWRERQVCPVGDAAESRPKVIARAIPKRKMLRRVWRPVRSFANTTLAQKPINNVRVRPRIEPIDLMRRRKTTFRGTWVSLIMSPSRCQTSTRHLISIAMCCVPRSARRRPYRNTEYILCLLIWGTPRSNCYIPMVLIALSPTFSTRSRMVECMYYACFTMDLGFSYRCL